MNGKKRISILTAVLIIAILAGVLLYSVLAADPPEPYTVLVNYFDSVQINYTVASPTLNYSGPADVPIGGIGIRNSGDSPGVLSTTIVQQAYCVDPYIPFGKPPSGGTTEQLYWGPTITNGYRGASDIYLPFSSAAKPFSTNYFAAPPYESWRPTLTHWRSDYYAATTWELSNAMKNQQKAVFWLVLNGYRGDFRNHDSESEDSLLRLNEWYAGGAIEGSPQYIDKAMAVMATKVAIWSVLTQNDPTGSFVFNHANLHGVEYMGVDRGVVFDNLLAALVRDANAAKAGSVPPGSSIAYTELTLAIDDSDILIESYRDSTHAYYPVYVTANLRNADTTDVGIDVFFTVTGPNARDVKFARFSGGTYTELGSEILPGTTDKLQSERYNFDGSNSISINNIYLKVPLSRIDFLGPDAAGSELLRVRARAHADNVPVAEGTPLAIAAASADGVMDWNMVQAFVGAAILNTKISMYAEASADIRGEREGELEINKKLQQLTSVDENRFFTFALYAGPSPEFNDARQVRLDFHDIDPADSRIGTTNTFRLKHDQTVKFTDLPESFYYWLVELNVGMSDFTAPWYAVTSGKPEVTSFPARAVSAAPNADGYRTCRFQLGEGAKAELTLTNTKEGERAVQTGDDRNIILPVAVISFGVLCLAGAEIYRRKLKKRAN